MKIYSLRPGARSTPPAAPPWNPDGPAPGYCHDCHNKARWHLTFGAKRPALRLCDRCAKYLVGVLRFRISEAEADDAAASAPPPTDEL